MRDIVIDGKDIMTISHLHKLLKEKLGFPDYYGENLDALWDCLTGYIEPTALQWLNFQDSFENLSDEVEEVVVVMREAEKEFGECFRLTLM
ncbi:ribonuclease inhibitor [Thermoactinomyces sp. DSM 45891]|uniref:barstar family protein n=1 Tax=Thermoactinomyces sp. DSM 45891 TaxID=1761907 RepID=UPI0009148738|nr:barstar family protein [Thermoactinomyces sp. DSM 45891]SFX09865.1 ribonuclease inhibitor [Thermoactinomyces sp. DSM 45891]